MRGLFRSNYISKHAEMVVSRQPRAKIKPRKQGCKSYIQNIFNILGLELYKEHMPIINRSTHPILTVIPLATEAQASQNQNF
jgi:hypothetical protein